MQNPLRSAASLLLLFAVFGSVASGQRAARASNPPHYIVDQARRAGYTHTTIAGAVATARPGEFILVRDGNYPEELRLDGKGVTIQGLDGGPLAFGTTVERIVVQNLGPNQTAAIRNIKLREIYEGIPLELTNNAGPVWLEDVRGPGFLGTGGRIENCAAVVLRRCTLELVFSDDGPPPAGLDITGGSTVALYECQLRGGPGPDLADPGGPGLVVDDSVVTLYASSVTGGTGFPCALGFAAGDGGPGVRVTGNGTLDVIGSTVTGGLGGVGGSCFAGNPGPAFEIVSGTVNPFASMARVLETSSPVRSGDPSTLTFTGLPGDTAFLLVARKPSSFSRQGMSVGPIVVPPTSMMVSLGSIPAGGVLTTTYTFPPVLSNVDSYYLQGVFINAALPETVIGTATQVHVLAPSF